MSGSERRSVILGTGSELPAKVITNRDLEKMVDTSDEWITVRTGIKERRVLEDGKGNADMAYAAAERALDDAGMSRPKISTRSLWARCRADYPFPEFRLCARRQARRAQRIFLRRRRGLFGFYQRACRSAIYTFAAAKSTKRWSLARIP